MQERIFNLIIASIAVFRLSVMISKESGPGWIFKKLRSLVRRKTPKKAHLDEGVACQFCTSVWIASLAALHLWLHDSEWLFLQIGIDFTMLVLCISGVAVVCNQLFTRDSK